MNQISQPMSGKLKTTIIQHPLISVLLLAISTLIFQYIPFFLSPESDATTLRFIGKVIISTLAVTLITMLGWLKEIGFTLRLNWREWLSYLPLLILPVLSALVSDFQVTSPTQITFFALFAFAIGFAEEVIVRGIFLRIFLPKGRLYAVLMSSLIFGLMHLGNLLIGADLGSTLTQVVYATLIGIAFAGVMLYGSSIWPLIVIHALVDFFPKLSGPSADNSGVDIVSALVLIAVQIPFAIYGCWLLRRRMKAEQAASFSV
jgi:membrane protease YdiL (CAAX protease family)